MKDRVFWCKFVIYLLILLFFALPVSGTLVELVKRLISGESIWVIF